MLLISFAYRGEPIVIRSSAIVALSPWNHNGIDRTRIHAGGVVFPVDGALADTVRRLNEVHRTDGHNE